MTYPFWKWLVLFHANLYFRNIYTSHLDGRIQHYSKQIMPLTDEKWMHWFINPTHIFLIVGYDYIQPIYSTHIWHSIKVLIYVCNHYRKSVKYWQMTYCFITITSIPRFIQRKILLLWYYKSLVSKLRVFHVKQRQWEYFRVLPFNTIHDTA